LPFFLTTTLKLLLQSLEDLTIKSIQGHLLLLTTLYSQRLSSLDLLNSNTLIQDIKHIPRLLWIPSIHKSWSSLGHWPKSSSFTL
jgi:hypothetical protein